MIVEDHLKNILSKQENKVLFPSLCRTSNPGKLLMLHRTLTQHSEISQRNTFPNRSKLPILKPQSMSSHKMR
jgi:hypothetical protein